MKCQATTVDAYRLLHQGSLTFAQMERNGCRINVDYLDKQITDTQRQIKELEGKLRSDKVYTLWQKEYGRNANLLSGAQLGKILYDKMGFEVTTRTKIEKRPKTDAKALEVIDHPFVRSYSRLLKLEKAKGKLLEIKRETVDGFVHPFLHLASGDDESGGARSYRSSSSDPNLQNIFSRDQEFAKLLKSAFIARENHQIVEVDFKVLEGMVGACYHKDPNMLRYFRDPTTDMHRDTAMDLFLLEKEQVEKRTTRDVAKNQFVFAEFYGSYYAQCARAIWEILGRRKMKLADGMLVLDWLKKKGIKDMGRCDPGARYEPEKGTFEYHLKQVEQVLWNERFPGYRDWKKEYHAEYIKNGYFDYLTGFRVEGDYRKNQVVNYPIQGCLAGSSKVLTLDGWIPIKELVGRKTKVWTGFKWADATGLDRGICKRAKVRLSSGLIVRCDIRHKLKNEKDEWTDFENLKVGDLVALPKNPVMLEASEEITWEFVLGFIIGDGHLGLRGSRKYLTITVGEKKVGVLRRIKDFLVGKGYMDGGYGGVHLDIIPPNGNKREKHRLHIEVERFTSFLESRGLVFGWNAHTKRVPESVWRSTLQQQRDFMEGLWLSDGCREGSNQRNLHMCNKKLLMDVQILIGPLGFDSVLCRTKDGHLLRVHWKKFNAKSPRKFPADTLLQMVSEVKIENYQDRCEPVTDSRACSRAKKGIDPSQYVAERVIEKNGTGDETVYRYDEIVGIQVLEEEETTYTMSVNDPLHQFVADGVIHKNTAFHCALWTTIRVQRWLTKNRMRSKLINTIHDSLIGDIHKRELEDYIAKVVEIVKVDLPRHWDWIITPLMVEVDVAPLGGSWWDKKSWELN